MFAFFKTKQENKIIKQEIQTINDLFKKFNGPATLSSNMDLSFSHNAVNRTTVSKELDSLKFHEETLTHFLKNVFSVETEIKSFALVSFIRNQNLTTEQKEYIFETFPNQKYQLAKAKTLTPALQLALAKYFEQVIFSDKNGTRFIVNNLFMFFLQRTDLSEETYRFLVKNFLPFLVDINKFTTKNLDIIFDELQKDYLLTNDFTNPMRSNCVKEDYVFSHDLSWKVISKFCATQKDKFYFTGQGLVSVSACLSECFNTGYLDDEVFQALQGTWFGSLHDLIEASIVFSSGSEN